MATVKCINHRLLDISKVQAMPVSVANNLEGSIYSKLQSTFLEIPHYHVLQVNTIICDDECCDSQADKRVLQPKTLKEMEYG